MLGGCEGEALTTGGVRKSSTPLHDSTGEGLQGLWRTMKGPTLQPLCVIMSNYFLCCWWTSGLVLNDNLWKLCKCMLFFSLYYFLCNWWIDDTQGKIKHTEQIHLSHSDLNCPWVNLERLILAIQSYLIVFCRTDSLLFILILNWFQIEGWCRAFSFIQPLCFTFWYIFWWK